MNITCAITDGMTPREKEIYFAHMAKRHHEEHEYLEARKQELRSYKESLIDEIISSGKNFTRDELKNKTVRVLEIIAY